MPLDPRLLEILACPEDKGPLFYFADEASLYNPRLKRRYRIDDGIPVMLVDEAETVGDDAHFEQDYQIEVYFERKNGEMFHLYAIWRQADFGGTFTTDNEGFQRLMLNNLADWDDSTEELCAEGRP